MKSVASLMAMAFIAFTLFSCGGKESKNNETKDSVKTEEQNSQANPDQLYGVEKGMIEYKMVTMGMPTTMTMYWKDFGKQSFTKSVMEMMGVKTESNMLNDGEFVYNWDAKTKQGSKVKVAKSSNDMNYNNLSKDVMDKYHMTNEGTEEIQGKKCDVFKMEFDGTKSKTWVWKGLAIKSETTAMGMTVTTEMTKMEEGAEAPAGSFDVPKDVKFQETKVPAK